MTSIYVASSWRNTVQPLVVEILRAAKFSVYDFRNPPGKAGFGWEQIDLARHPDGTTSISEFLHGLNRPSAVAGFNTDMDALKTADITMLVLPCGRSAHLELGWAIGAGKKTAVLLDEPCTPELMYKAADHLAPSMIDMLGWLGVKD